MLNLWSELAIAMLLACGGAAPPAGESWEGRCRLLLERVLAADPDSRERVWAEGLPDLRRGPATDFPAATSAAIDEVTDALDRQGPPGLADRILLNLSAIAGTDAAANRRLQEKMELRRVRARFGLRAPVRDEVQVAGTRPAATQPAATRPAATRPTEVLPGAADPPNARRLMMEAAIQEAVGNEAEAGRRYANVIDLCGGKGDVALLARRKLVRLMLDSFKSDAAQVQAQLDALRATRTPFEAELWDWQCRLIIRDIIAAPPAEREQVWRARLPLLRWERPWLSPAGLSDLDRMASALGDAPLADQVLADVVLLFPDRATLWKVQLKRVDRFARRKAWDEAAAAADLAVLAAGLSRDGPLAAYREARQLLAGSGAPAGTVLEPSRWAGGSPRRSPVDPLLKRTAEAARAAAAESGQPQQPPNRRALLNACAGDAPSAARSAHAHAAVGPAPVSPDAAVDALDDVAFVIAVTDGSFADPFRFGRWLARPHSPAASESASESDPYVPASVAQVSGADPGRAQAPAPRAPASRAQFRQASGIPSGTAREWLDQWERRLVGWGSEALASSEPEWAKVLWAMALNARAARDDSDLLARIFDAAGLSQPADQADKAVDLVAKLVPMLRGPTDRRDIYEKLAAVRVEQGKFQEAIQELDRPDAGPETMTGGHTRAMALIRLDKLDEAVKRLEQMEGMNGGDEERARAVFLIGWIHLRRDDRARAAVAFERAADRYPQTAPGKKAKELLHVVEGGR